MTQTSATGELDGHLAISASDKKQLDSRLLYALSYCGARNCFVIAGSSINQQQVYKDRREWDDLLFSTSHRQRRKSRAQDSLNKQRPWNGMQWLAISEPPVSKTRVPFTQTYDSLRSWRSRVLPFIIFFFIFFTLLPWFFFFHPFELRITKGIVIKGTRRRHNAEALGN